MTTPTKDTPDKLAERLRDAASMRRGEECAELWLESATALDSLQAQLAEAQKQLAAAKDDKDVMTGQIKYLREQLAAKDADCGNPQCAQVHALLDSLLEYYGATGHENIVSAGKTVHLMDAIKTKDADLATAKAEIERLNKCCAEMRDLIEDVGIVNPKSFRNENSWFTDKEHALSTNAGKDYIHRDSIKPQMELLRECLTICKRLQGGHTFFGYSGVSRDAEKLLSRAAELGVKP